MSISEIDRQAMMFTVYLKEKGLVEDFRDWLIERNKKQLEQLTKEGTNTK